MADRGQAAGAEAVVRFLWMIDAGGHTGYRVMRAISAIVSVTMSVAALLCAAEPTVYVTVSGENRIAIYDLADGNLRSRASVPVDGPPGALVLSPNRDRLFVALRSVKSVASFQVDALTGNLELINQVPAGGEPSYLSVHPSGRFLFSALYRDGKVSVHQIEPSGHIGSQQQSISTDEFPHSVVGDSSGKYWFVPHTDPNVIFQFRWDTTKQSLVPGEPPKLFRNPHTGPRHLWFHPSGEPFAYSSDEQGRSVSTYRMDPTGGLELLQTLSTLPPGQDIQRSKSTSDIEVHPSGNFVYVANRGLDSLARFRVEETRLLRYIGETPTEPTTRSFNIDRSGKYLIAAGQESGKLAVFAIDGDSGDLHRVSSITVGESPWWVVTR